jgi:hypothetical protein
MYDIIFSINVHESYDCTIDMINNIDLCNSHINFLIVIHANISMYNQLKKYQHDKVLLNPLPYDKKWLSYTLLKGHIDNFLYLKNKNISFKHFMLLASNCMFIKKGYNPRGYDLLPHPNLYSTFDNEPHLKKWGHWEKLLKNNKLIEKFDSMGIEIKKKLHEGTVLTYEVFDKMIEMINEHDMFGLIEYDLCFEEIILPSLENYLTGRVSYRVCKVFRDNRDWVPTKKQIVELHNDDYTYVVKRVNRMINDHIRIFINYITRYEMSSSYTVSSFNWNETKHMKNRVGYFNNNYGACIKYETMHVDNDNSSHQSIHFIKFNNKSFYSWFGRHLPKGIYTFDFDVMFNKNIPKKQPNDSKIGIKTHNPTKIIEVFNGIKKNIYTHITVTIDVNDNDLVIFYFDDYVDDLYVNVRNLKVKRNNIFVIFS